MKNKLDKKLINIVIFSVLIVIFFLALYFFRAHSLKAEEEIKIFPTGWLGDWKNPETISSQDLEEGSALDQFNSQNSIQPQGIGDDADLLIPPLENIIENTDNNLLETKQVSPESESEPEAEPTPVSEPEVILEQEPELIPDVQSQSTSIDNNIEQAPTEQPLGEQSPEIPQEENPTPVENNSNSENNSSEPISFWNDLKKFFKTIPVLAQEENLTPAPAEDSENQKLENDNSIESDVNQASEELPVETPIPENNQPEIINQQINEDIFELNNFSIDEDFLALTEQIVNIQLRVSMAGQGGVGDKLVLEYSWKDAWQNLGELDLKQGFSNATNGGYFLFGLPATNSPEFFKNFKVRFIYIDAQDDNEIVKNKVFIDSAWLEVEYEKKIQEIKEEQVIEEPSEKMEKTNLFDEKFEVVNKKTFFSDENPEFIIYEKNRNFLDDIKSLFETKNFQATLINPDGEKENNNIQIQNGQIKIFKNNQKSFKPGLYKLMVTSYGESENLEKEIDFTWGVLGINTNKSIYLPGEQAYLQMAVLSNFGRTICNANLRLEITNPRLGTIIFSTQEGTIKYSDTCGQNNVTDNPDYFSYYQVNEVGNYEVKLINLDNGYEINDTFQVNDNLPFEIERIGASRINPFAANYWMTLKIKANQDFDGKIYESIPDDFQVRSEEKIELEKIDGINKISWQKKINAGEEVTLRYEYDAPNISPELYLLGPIKILENENILFEESRHWQLTSDVTNMLLFWAGSGGSCSGAGAPPSGWTLVNDGSFTAVFPRGDSTYTANEGGSATHTHTASGTSTASSNTRVLSTTGAGTNVLYTHTHSVTISSVGTASSLPLYKDLCVIKLSAGGIPSGATAIPQNAITIFDNTPPLGWSDYSSTFGTYYLRGNTTPGGTSGSNTHANPGHLISGTLDATTGTIKDTTDKTTNASDKSHTHTLSVSSTDAPSIEPLSQEVILGQKTGEAGPLVSDMIAIFDGDPGSGWDIKSDGSDDFATKYIKVTGTYKNNASGNTIHGHRQIDTTSGSYTATVLTGVSATSSLITNHSHPVSITINDGTNTNLPPYTDVVIAKNLGNLVPTFASDATCGGSYPCENPASTAASPTNEGSAVTFYGTATDGNGDQWKLLVCKTDGTSGTDCDGGVLDSWCVSSSFVDSGSQNNCSYTTQDGDNSSNIWYAYGCDSTACTAVGNQGSGDSGSPFETNHDPSFTIFSNNSPINPDGVVTFSSTASDSDASDTVTLYVCKTNSFTAPSTCNGGEWCHSSASASNPSCQYDDADDIFQDKNWDAYGYIVDAHGLISSTGGAQGTNSKFTVSNIAPIISAASIVLTDSDGSGNLIPKTEQAETTGFYADFVVTDMNSCLNASSGNEIASAIINVYRATAPGDPGPTSCDTSGEYDPNFCYPDADVSWDPVCTQTGTCGGDNDSTIEWRCTFPLQYHVDPTVVGSKYPDDEWYAAIQATDDNSATSILTEDDDGNEMDIFLSQDVTSEINYGNILPNGTSAGQTVTITATGNVGLDEYLSGTDMGTTPHIDVGQQKYHLSTLDFDWDSGGGVALTTTPVLELVNVPKTTVSAIPAADNFYCKLRIPASQPAGLYSGTNTITANSSDPNNW